MLGEDDTLRRLERAAQATANVEPLDEWVTITPSAEDHETRTGLIIPSSADSAVRSGVILACGDDVSGVVPGDKVLYARANALEVRLSGEPVLLVRRRDVVARYSE